MIKFPTHAEVDAMKSHGYEPETVLESRRLADLGVRAAALCREIETAFAGVVLGHGTGLSEARGLDDHYDAARLAKMRQKDEKKDWRKLPSENSTSGCFCFMNAEGMRFHLPACMISELKGDAFNHFDWRLCPVVSEYPSGWSVQQMHSLRDILTPAQHRCVREFLLIHREAMEWPDTPERIDRALEELWVED